jgi:hypothetical protein
MISKMTNKTPLESVVLTSGFFILYLSGIALAFGMPNLSNFHVLFTLFILFLLNYMLWNLGRWFYQIYKVLLFIFFTWLLLIIWYPARTIEPILSTSELNPIDLFSPIIILEIVCCVFAGRGCELLIELVFFNSHSWNTIRFETQTTVGNGEIEIVEGDDDDAEYEISIRPANGYGVWDPTEISVSDINYTKALIKFLPCVACPFLHRGIFCRFWQVYCVKGLISMVQVHNQLECKF